MRRRFSGPGSSSTRRWRVDREPILAGFGTSSGTGGGVHRRPGRARLPDFPWARGRQFLAALTGFGIFRGLTATLNPETHQARTGNALYVFALPE